jgi:hypothetical protein
MAYVSGWANRLAGTTEYPGDLAVPLEEESQFVRLLGDRSLLVYHCSRLLDFEVESVRREGLRALSAGLVARKLNVAHAAGALTADQHARLLDSHVYALDNSDGRGGKVCALVGRTALDDPFGLERLLSIWGGEAIYWAHGDDPADDPLRLGGALRGLGRPAVVTLAVDLGALGRDATLFFPPLHRLFVATILELNEVCGEAHIPTAVQGSEVVDIWQPGHPEYDRHPTLPGS